MCFTERDTDKKSSSHVRKALCGLLRFLLVFAKLSAAEDLPNDSRKSFSEVLFDDNNEFVYVNTNKQITLFTG